MKKISEILFLGGFGGSLYYGIEIAYRGYSHWSMFLLGGICMIFISAQGKCCEWKDPLGIQLFRCTLFVMCSEFITGIIVNKWFRWNVWDYSAEKFQIFGQICLGYTLIFSLLCLFAIVVCRFINVYIYH